MDEVFNRRDVWIRVEIQTQPLKNTRSEQPKLMTNHEILRCLEINQNKKPFLKDVISWEYNNDQPEIEKFGLVIILLGTWKKMHWKNFNLLFGIRAPKVIEYMRSLITVDNSLPVCYMILFFWVNIKFQFSARSFRFSGLA